MPRVVASACVVLAVCFGGAAWAKPKIAILGLEAAPGLTGAVDPATTQVARVITKELRQRAQAAASPYALAPNSSKELTDEKLLMSCDTEAASCMAVIGAGLAADVLLYGRVEKKGEVYRVSLKRLDVRSRTISAGGEELAIGGAVATMSRRLYIKLVGESSVVGTLNIKATGQAGALIGTGTVLVDDEPRGTLAEGRVTVTGIPEGRHVLAIDASGYRRFEETVTVRGGEQLTLSALLLAGGDERTSGAPHATLWKWTLGAGLVVAVAGGGLAGYSYSQQVHYAGDELDVKGNDRGKISSDDCGKDPAQLMEETGITFNVRAFEQSCKWHKRIYPGYIIAGVGVVGAVVSLIMLSRDPSPAESRPAVARGKQLVVTPIVTPDGAGASVSLSW